ncbi:MAG TPA: thiamine phosphate synthase [Candidatus Bacteroides avicola]|uniref:Thiamine phosphate synthase n=1 Tax=Candidatus Bacteroides avicola TaxID=2838468 RepID=A0A9D2HVN5_9BACE|nr:thiamine phosphate synthase [Mediterranea sp. An20]MBW9201807.1 thiamine phosphate synthase [Bacteroidales bacterium SW292]OUP09986.1 thiamine phosphate pyrophosphorylase [Mediterranea sp. An20]HJA85461.1 thiamine phosphate synthase [Candidatus Bacteroides avicola]
MKLIVVTTPTFFVEEDQILTALFEEGLDILHLRKPETPAMYSERLLTLIPQKYHKRIVTHEHFYLQEEFGLMGIHLNRRNPSEPHDYSGHISCTCRTLSELSSKKHFYDYLFLSPVFDSVSSPRPASFTTEELRQGSHDKLIDNKIMALGGVRWENIPLVRDLGFGGAVIMGDLWSKFNACTDRDYRGIIEYFKKLRKAVD